VFLNARCPVVEIEIAVDNLVDTSLILESMTVHAHGRFQVAVLACDVWNTKTRSLAVAKIIRGYR